MAGTSGGRAGSRGTERARDARGRLLALPDTCVPLIHERETEGAWRAPPAMAGPHHAALHPARAHRRRPFVLTEPAGCIRTPSPVSGSCRPASRRGPAVGPSCEHGPGRLLRGVPPEPAPREARRAAAPRPAGPPPRPPHRRSLCGQPTETTRSSTASRSVLFIYFFDLRKDAGYLFIYLFFPHRKTATMPNRETGRRGPMISVSVTFFGVFDHWSSCPVDGRQSDFVPLGAGAVRGVG